MGNKQLAAEKVMQCLLIALAAIFILITLNNLVRPAYIKLINEDVKLCIAAAAEQNDDALANNVRLTHVAVNGRDIDLAEVPLDPDSEWKYDSKNDFIYAYNLEQRTEISIGLKNVHSVSVTLVQEKGAGKAELLLNDSLWKSVDLYKNTDWEEISFSKNMSVILYAEHNPFMLTGAFILIFFICYFVTRKYNSHLKTISKTAVCIIIAWHLGIVNAFISVFIQYGSFLNAFHYICSQSHLFLECIILQFLCITAFRILTGRMWIGYTVSAFVTVLLPVISNAKLSSRGVPLLPWDFSMAGAAMSVADGYRISLSIAEIVCIAAAVCIVVILISLGQRSDKSTALLKIAAVPVLVVLFVFINTHYINSEVEDNNTEYRVYQVGSYYDQRGFIPAFLEYCSYLCAPDEPDGYSKSAVESIAGQINLDFSENKGNKKPNIIAVMDESFWDAERLDSIEFKEELLPNYEKLKAESSYGNLFTHVLNGGTVTSEFEFLTGFSGEFFPQDYMVYGSFIDNDFPSVVSILESQGYKTMAIHPYNSTNYNRENAYVKFGFDECIFEDSFDDQEMVRGYISDECVCEKIENVFEQNKSDDAPQFIFAVTMQNHGGFWEEQTYKPSAVKFNTDKYGDVAKACMTDYFSGLHESDRVLGELTDYFRETDEETIIIYFGDHMSDAGPKDDRMFDGTSWNNNLLKYDYETHIVPFLVWCNYDMNSRDWGIMEVGQLLPCVFDEYGIESTNLWNFLVQLRKYYAAADNCIVVDSNSRYASVSEMTEEQRSMRDIYRLLQYDCIWGEKYGIDLCELNEH